MPFLLFFLVLFFILPSFILLLFLLAVVLLPVWLATGSLSWAFVGPTPLIGLLRSAWTRRNHALLHGTISVLEERYGRLNVEGVALDDGFSLRGGLDRQEVFAAAQQALARLRRGETSLAFRGRCGAAVMMSAIPIGLIALVLLWWKSEVTLLGVSAAVALALALAYTAAPFLQRRLLSTDLGSMEVTGVEERVRRGRAVLFITGELFVRTRSSEGPLEAEVLLP